MDASNMSTAITLPSFVHQPDTAIFVSLPSKPVHLSLNDITTSTTIATTTTISTNAISATTTINSGSSASSTTASTKQASNSPSATTTLVETQAITFRYYFPLSFTTNMRKLRGG